MNIKCTTETVYFTRRAGAERCPRAINTGVIADDSQTPPFIPQHHITLLSPELTADADINARKKSSFWLLHTTNITSSSCRKKKTFFVNTIIKETRRNSANSQQWWWVPKEKRGDDVMSASPASYIIDERHQRHHVSPR